VQSSVSIQLPSSRAVLTERDGAGDIKSIPVGTAGRVQGQPAEGMQPAVGIEGHATDGSCGTDGRRRADPQYAGQDGGGQQRSATPPQMRHGKWLIIGGISGR